MNPLPNRPLLNNPSLPLAIPNVPSLEQMPYNGRPRKLVPEVGKDFPVLNGVPIMSGPMTAPAGSGPQGPILEKEGRMMNGSNLNSQQTASQQQDSQSTSGFQHQQQQQQQLAPGQGQPVQLDGQQGNTIKDSQEEKSERQQITSIFRPDSDWREQLERARSETQSVTPSSVSAWENGKEDDDTEKEDVEMEDDEASSMASDDDGKVWRPRRTLRKSVSFACGPLQS